LYAAYPHVIEHCPIRILQARGGGAIPRLAFYRQSIVLWPFQEPTSRGTSTTQSSFVIINDLDQINEPIISTIVI
jgi:hypothetical protein